MLSYWAVFSARFRVLLQYRAAAAAGFACQLFWGLIRMMIFTAFYHSTTAPQPMTLAQTVTYVWLGQAFLGLVLFRIDHELEAMIRTGGVAYEMLRPIRLYDLWLARTAAHELSAGESSCYFPERGNLHELASLSSRSVLLTMTIRPCLEQERSWYFPVNGFLPVEHGLFNRLRKPTRVGERRSADRQA